jgi:hypothetical protein
MPIHQAAFVFARRRFLQKSCDILPAMNRPSPLCVIFLTMMGSSAFGQQSKSSTTLKPTPSGASATAVSPEAEEVLAFERSMEAAVVRGDVSYVDSVSAPDLTFTHGDAWTTGGKPLLVDDKRTFLQRVQNKQYNARDLDSVKVEMHGDIAITYGRYVAQNRTAKPEQSWFSVWFERVYEKRDGHWLYVSHRTVHGPTYGPDRQSVSDK